MSASEKAARFISVLPHCGVLGMSVEYADSEKLILKLPYQSQIVGNPENGVVAGGSLTTLMDTACGTAVFIAFSDHEICPTLDLRMDYHTSARPGSDLMGEAWVERISNNVVFTRGRIYQEGSDETIATCTANFMRIGKHIGGQG